MQIDNTLDLAPSKASRRSITELTDTIVSLCKNEDLCKDVTELEASKLFDAMLALRSVLETPGQALNRIIFSCRTLPVIRIAQGMGVFDTFAAHPNSPLSIDDLNGHTKGDRALLVRIMRLLSHEQVVHKLPEGKYRLRPFALTFANDTPTGWCIKHSSNTSVTATRANDYLRNRDYMSPDDAFDAPHQYANLTTSHYFQWLSELDERQDAFNATMSLPRHDAEQEWFTYFPVDEKMDVSPDHTAWVDVGGGIGHDTARLRQAKPDLKGRFVLQDLKAVVDAIREPLPAGIEVMAHDMFNEQPVQGARVYYMRTVLHDWPNKQALAVLERIRDAMNKDSILLINENMLSGPEAEDNAVVAHTDFTMMLNFSSLERTEEQWITLLEEARLKVVKVWKPRDDIKSRALFEAVLADGDGPRSRI